MRTTTWHGTLQESPQLLSAIDHHCACAVDENGIRSGICAAHWMLVHDQRGLGGLLFARRCLRHRVSREEWSATSV